MVSTVVARALAGSTLSVLAGKRNLLPATKTLHLLNHPGTLIPVYTLTLTLSKVNPGIVLNAGKYASALIHVFTYLILPTNVAPPLPPYFRAQTRLKNLPLQLKLNYIVS